MKVQQSSSTLNINKARLVNNVKQDTSAESTSLGYRLNNNNDNTVISGRYNNDKKAQMLEIKEAIRKSNDGSALIKTFEGALGETVNIIRRMKDLAGEASNSEYTDSDRVVIETEFRELRGSINELAKTDYNGYSMLLGSSTQSKLAAIEDTINTEITPAMQKAVNEIALYATSTITCGDLTISGNNLVEGVDYSYSNNTLTILSDKQMILSGTSTVDHVVVKKDVNANLTLANLDLRFDDGDLSSNMDLPGTCAFEIEDNSKGNIHITLVGKNTLESGIYCAGLQKSGGTDTGTLTIEGDGELNAVGKGGGAGIGGKAGAFAPSPASDSSGCNITINSGTINATSKEDHEGNNASWGFEGGAGIGGGRNGDARNITINGGIISATSDHGSGIGGGFDGGGTMSDLNTWGGNAVNIVINGGVIYAEGGSSSILIQSGAGIGSCRGYETDIKINGGKITAIGHNEGAGIGCATPLTELPNNHKITITGGEVLAIATTAFTTDIICGAGIGAGGSGFYSDSSMMVLASVTISGKDTVVIAYSERADDIGNGRSYGNPVKSDVTLNDRLISEKFSDKTNLDKILNGRISEEFKQMLANANLPYGTVVYSAHKSDTGTETNSKPNSDLGGIVLQTGSRSKDAVRFTFNYSSVGIGNLRNDLNTTAKGLGLDTLSMATEEDAAYALDQIDYALNKAAAIMSRFELAQSKIESTDDKLQNPDLSFLYNRGDFEDTNAASEFSQYIKQFILNNADDSMAAQAIQTPQALDLLE